VRRLAHTTVRASSPDPSFRTGKAKIAAKNAADKARAEAEKQKSPQLLEGAKIDEDQLN
jgi:hypothetical protein